METLIAMHDSPSTEWVTIQMHLIIEQRNVQEMIYGHVEATLTIGETIYLIHRHLDNMRLRNAEV